MSATGINASTFPRWSKDGKQLYYQSTDNRMMSAGINSRGSTFGVEKVEQLFEIRTKGLSLFQDVTADGQQFLFINAAGGESSAPVSLITGWDAEVKR